MTFPIYQFTMQELAIQGKAEAIAGADFYFDWIDEGAMPVQFVQRPGELANSPVILSGALPSEKDINQNY